MEQVSKIEFQYYLVRFNIGTTQACNNADSVKKLHDILEQCETCLHKFKVVGEPLILAVYKIRNDSVMKFEKMMNNFGTCEYTNVVCDALYPYEEFAQTLGVDKSLTSPSQSKLTAKQYLWVEATVDYPGMGLQELINTWRAEAAAVLTSRQGGAEFAIYKQCAKRTVQFFTASSAAEFDAPSYTIPTLPMIESNGNNVKLTAKSVLNLDRYIVI